MPDWGANRTTHLSTIETPNIKIDKSVVENMTLHTRVCGRVVRLYC